MIIKNIAFTLLILISINSHASWLSSINAIAEDIAPILEDLFFDAEKIAKNRENDYTRYLNELSMIEDPDAFKKRSFEILNTLKSEDKQLSEQLKRIESKVSALKAQEKKYQHVVAIAQEEQQALQRKQDLYITGLLGAGTAALLAVIGLLIRIPTIFLERQALKLDIALKDQQLHKKKAPQQ